MRHGIACVLAALVTCPALSCQDNTAPIPANAASAPAPAAQLPHAPVIDEQRLLAFLRALPTKRSATGDAAHKQGLRDTEQLIQTTLAHAGYTPRLWPFKWSPTTHALDDAPPKSSPAQPTDAPQPDTWHNIIAELPGTSHPDDIVIIGAHFDSVPNSPGADDNGTGTAALMELACSFHGERFDRTVRFVFFNVEEPGLIGSRRYAAAAKAAMDNPKADAPPKRVVAMLSLEMLGYYCSTEGCQKSPIPAIPGLFEPPTVGDFLAIATTTSHNWLGELIEREWLKAEPTFKLVRPDFIPDVPKTPVDLLRSDHAPFLFIGVPAAIIADTANFRSPHYHQPTDTVDTLDLAKFTQAVRGLAAVVPALAASNAGPRPAPAAPADK